MVRTALVTDSRGQSEVTGTILLVAIAIVMGAVVGGYVFNVTQTESKTTPQVTFSYDYDESNKKLTITHESGDKLDSDNVEFVCKSGACGGLTPSTWSVDEVTSGDSETISPVGPDSEILVVWEQPIQAGKTAVLDEWEGPQA